MKKIMLVAGEASGEQHGAELVKALRQQNNDLHFYGVGGRSMRAVGVEILVNCNELAVMGFGDVIKHLPQILRVMKKIKTSLRGNRPDLLILIDYPGFNLRLAKFAKKLGIKVLFYISPQVWAWRAGRVKKIARVVDHLAVIFPFEVDCYKDVNLAVTYVGHPLTKIVKPSLSITAAKAKFALPENVPIVGLLPGSRQIEIKRLLPTLLKAAEKIHLQRPDVKFILPVASTISTTLLNHYLKDSAVKIMLLENGGYDAINICDAVIVCSGTATLEAGLLGIPMVIVYKIPYFAALILKRLVKVAHIGLCNIVANKRIVPELLQEEANPDKISEIILRILNDQTYRHTMQDELHAMRTKMGTLDGSTNVAKIALEMLK